MKRNQEFIRDILFAIEELDVPGEQECDEALLQKHLSPKNYSDDLEQHCDILRQSGFIVYYGGEMSLNAGRVQLSSIKLTAQGHEYLDEIRDDGVWDKVKKKVGGGSISVSFAVLKMVAQQIIKNQLKGE